MGEKTGTTTTGREYVLRGYSASGGRIGFEVIDEDGHAAGSIQIEADTLEWVTLVRQADGTERRDLDMTFSVPLVAIDSVLHSREQVVRAWTAATDAEARLDGCEFPALDEDDDPTDDDEPCGAAVTMVADVVEGDGENRVYRFCTEHGEFVRDRAASDPGLDGWNPYAVRWSTRA
jgi:hypothetical protein